MEAETKPKAKKSLTSSVRNFFHNHWSNRHGPKLKMFGPRYPNTIEFQRSAEGQRVYAEHDRIEAGIVGGMAAVAMGGAGAGAT